MDKLYAWDKHLARVLMVSFFLPLRVQVMVMIPICIFMGIRDLVIPREQIKIPYKQALLSGSIYLLYALYLPFTKGLHLKHLFFDMEQKASLLLLPLIFACIQQQTRKTILSQLHFFIIGCLASCIIANGAFIINKVLLSAIDTSMPGHVVYRRYFEDISGVHPTYMGMYISFSVAVLLFNNDVKYRLNKWSVAIVLFLLFLFLLALLPKTPLLALFFVLGYYCLTQYGNKPKWVIPLVVLGVSVLIAYFAIPFSSERLVEMKGLVAGKKGMNPIDNSINMRQLIWKVDTNLLREYWLTGVGPGQLREALTTQYFLLSFLVGIPLGYFDTHNEYMNIWLAFGLTGIILFLFILVFQFIRAIKAKAHLYICLLTVLAICFTTENILATQHGIVFYAFFTSLFFFILEGEKKPKTFI